MLLFFPFDMMGPVVPAGIFVLPLSLLYTTTVFVFLFVFSICSFRDHRHSHLRLNVHICFRFRLHPCFVDLLIAFVFVILLAFLSG